MSLLTAALAGGAAVAGVLVPTDAQASVSIAIGFDALVKDADSVGIVTPVESKSVWEAGRIYTYTRVKVDQGVAGELATGSDAWVRTMGGVVGKIGQLVDGEAVLTTGKPSLLFLRKFTQGGTWEVSARGQGQYPVVADDTSGTATAKSRKLIRSHAAGVLLPPKVSTTPTAVPLGPVQAPDSAPAASAAPLRLATDALHDRSLDDATREIAASWKRLHPAASDSKK